MKLEIELVPMPCWGRNLPKLLRKSDWDKIRKNVYAQAEMKCQICGEECTSLDAHEVWNFDEKNHIQKLVDIIGVCKACHSAIHFGRAQRCGYEEDAREQFLKVNCCDIAELNSHLMKVKKDFDRRNKIEDWELDLSFIEDRGYMIKQ